MKRTTQIVGALALIGGCLVGAQMVGAHHAMVMYDGTKTVTIDGAVLDFRWTNPHVFIRVEGRRDQGAEMEIWLLETSSPINLARLGGWSESLLKAGDRVRVEINPHHESERKEARLMKLTLLDTGLVLGTAYRGPQPSRSQ